MEMKNIIIGGWMAFTGCVVIVYALSLDPYMSTLSGVERYIIPISSAVLLGVPSGVLCALGFLQVIGKITILIGGK